MWGSPQARRSRPVPRHGVHGRARRSQRRPWGGGSRGGCQQLTAATIAAPDATARRGAGSGRPPWTQTPPTRVASTCRSSSRTARSASSPDRDRALAGSAGQARARGWRWPAPPPRGDPDPAPHGVGDGSVHGQRAAGQGLTVRAAWRDPRRPRSSWRRAGSPIGHAGAGHGVGDQPYAERRPWPGAPGAGPARSRGRRRRSARR